MRNTVRIPCGKSKRNEQGFPQSLITVEDKGRKGAQRWGVLTSVRRRRAITQKKVDKSTQLYEQAEPWRTRRSNRSLAHVISTDCQPQSLVMHSPSIPSGSRTSARLHRPSKSFREIGARKTDRSRIGRRRWANRRRTPRRNDKYRERWP
jgi:hypothetical protein